MRHPAAARSTLISAALALAVTAFVPAAGATAAGTPPAAADPTTLVNPFIGTGDGGPVVGPVDMFPGAAMPFGMLAWSPDTPSRPSSGGYSYADSSTIGMSVTHISGAGCNIAGDLPILPTTGDIGTNPAAATEPFSHGDEQASPGSYSTLLGADRSISVKLAATARTGIGELGFPATTAANVLFKTGDSQGGNSGSDVQVVGSNQLTGSISGGHFCGHENAETVYFAAVFDRPFASYGTWDGTTVSPGTKAASGPKAGAWVGFDTTTNGQVGLKVAVSYVSTANAWANLAAEDPGWSLPAVAAKAHDSWRKLLSQIQVAGGTHDQQVQFYTALYHTLLDPTLFNDVNGEYIGFDQKVHTVPAGTSQYANFSGWDIYRSEVPLLALLAPEQTSQMMRSLVDDEAQGGWLPKWPVANGYTGVMNGDAADPIIAEAYAFGARDFDTQAALAAMVKGATVVPTPSQLGQGWYEERPGLSDYLKLGYVPNTTASSISQVPNGASETLEYATADFSIAEFARSLGESDLYHQFLTRSQNWTNLYNVDSGFLQPRDGSGIFPAGNPVTDGLSVFGQSGFQEGNAAQYAWSVPQNLGGLIAAMGGDAVADRRLDDFFGGLNVGPNTPQYWAGNETDLLAPWVYDYAGEPYKTQATVRKITSTIYANTPGGEPGNDDLGAMSSWYVWAALGLYPETPGAPVLAVGSPLFPSISIHTSQGRTTISAPGDNDQNFYVRHLNVNGRSWSKDWVPASILGSQGRPSSLDFTVGSTPDVGWASHSSDEPPSYPAGPTTFPPGITPVSFTTAPAALDVPVGGQVSSTVSLTVGAGSQVTPPSPVKTVSWSASPPAGVTVTPSSGSAPVAADGTTKVTFSVSAATTATQGFDTIPLTLSSSPSVPLPQITVPVTVIGTGDTANVCSTLGTTNTNQGLAQNEQEGDGVTTPVTVGGQSGRSTVQVVVNDLNMYFQLDPRIAFDQRTSTTFTITYYDSGTNGWSIQYDQFGGAAYQGAFSVTNQGTNTWKTVTFTVPDSGFGNRENGQSDFRIASASPVTIHSVKLSVSGPGVLPVSLCS